MIRSINTIVDEINNRIASNYSNENLYNVAVLQQDENGRTFPMARQNSDDGYQISPLDTNGLQIYHRQISPVEIRPLEGKGKKSYQLAVYPMKLVGVGYRPNITNSDDWNNSDVANDLMRILGKNAYLSGKETLQVNGRAVNDKIQVLNEEFSGHQLSNETLRLIAFSIEYTITQRQICYGDIVSELASLSYSNNYQTLDGSFTTMSPTLFPTGATAAYSAIVPSGLSINTSTGDITEDDYDSISDGLTRFTVTATGTGVYAGTLTFEIVFVKGVASGSVTGLSYSNDDQTIWQASGDTGSFSNMNPTTTPSNATGTYSSDDLPAGLNLDSSTGVISVGTYGNIPTGESTFTVTFNGSGGFTGSANANLTLTKETLWELTDLSSGLEIFIDYTENGTQTTSSFGNATVFDQINDLSGNGRNAISTTDDFKAIVSSLDVDTVVSRQVGMHTADTLLRIAMGTSVSQPFTMFFSGVLPPSTLSYIFGQETDPNNNRIFYDTAGERFFFASGSSWQSFFDNGEMNKIFNMKPSIWEFRYDGASSFIRVDDEESLSLSGGNPGTNGLSGNIRIGNFGSSNSAGMGALIGKWAIVSGTPSSADRDRIIGALAWDIGSQAKLPAAFAYKSLPPFA